MTMQLKSVSDVQAISASIPSYGAPVQARGLYRTVLKRLFDILFVLVTAPITVPFVLVAAIIVALDGHSPFFLQKRVGRNNREFLIVKLRTMTHDAESTLEAHLAGDAEARREWDATQKLKNDPRVTAFGRLLRKTSLDELPQFWNVFQGDMSVVGPRPMMSDQRSLYPGRAYFDLRPGVTGPWQVSARNGSEFRSRAEFDDRYYAEVSFLTDTAILFRTVRAVLRGTGY